MSYVESKLSIESFIAKLKYAIKHHTARIILQLIRKVDENRAIRFSNGFAIADLFPDENPVEKLKHEIAVLTIDNYIESIHDSRFPDRSDMRVFGKRYPKGDIYIKIRVELMSPQVSGNDLVFVMSFHYAEHDFSCSDYPYAAN